MKKQITKENKLAIALIKSLSKEIILSGLYETLIAKIRSGMSYTDSIKDVLLDHPAINKTKKTTLRATTRTVLQECLNREDYEEIFKKRMSLGGKEGVKIHQERTGKKPFNEQELSFLNKIGNNPTEYKKGTNWNIKKITQEMEGSTGIKRKSTFIIKAYLRKNFTKIKRVFIPWNQNTEETQYLETLYKKNKKKHTKLPIKEITNKLNEKFNHKRTVNAVGNYIKNNFKSNEEKEKNTSRKRTSAEDEILQTLIGTNKYITGRFTGSYIADKIFLAFKMKTPNTIRTAKGVKHRIGKLEKKG